MFPKRILISAVIASVIVASAARASRIPDPPLCTVPTPIVLCPQGDLDYRTTMRLVSNDPIVDDPVDLRFCDAGGWVFAATGQPAGVTFTSACDPSAITDVNGIASFPVKAGGSTGSATLRIFCVGVLVGQRSFTSPDQNGDLMVNASDLSLLLDKIFHAPTDPSGDLNGSGKTDAGDLAVLLRHLGHHS